jgi:L-asparaginase
MNKILLISTGGTFNKVYDPKNGELIIDKTSNAVKEIASHWLCKFDLVNMIGKDSLEMSNNDRLELLAMISQSEYKKIVIIHGTDTMTLTAEYLANAKLDKQLILTGAMVPYSINPVEATANLASAFGCLQTLDQSGVYIVMNGLFGSYEKIEKDRKKGKFIVT